MRSVGETSLPTEAMRLASPRCQEEIYRDTAGVYPDRPFDLQSLWRLKPGWSENHEAPTRSESVSHYRIQPLVEGAGAAIVADPSTIGRVGNDQRRTVDIVQGGEVSSGQADPFEPC